MYEFGEFIQKNAWGLAVLIGLFGATIIGVVSLIENDPEPQPDLWETDCQWIWADGPYGQTLVCR